MYNWSDVRSQFSLDNAYIHLGLAMLNPHPQAVREQIDKHRKGFDQNPTLYFRNKDHYEELVLEAAARYLETSSHHIALTESTTMGLAVVLTGFKMKPDEEIISTVHEHYAAMEILRFKKQREGVTTHQVTLYDHAEDVEEQMIVNQLMQHVNAKTRLILVTWVHSSTGVKIPIHLISKALAKVNQSRNEQEKVILAVDALHGFGVEELKIEETGCDFFIAGCHKWLYGPRGTGIVWGTEQGWNRLNPIMTSFKSEAFFPWFQQKIPEDSCPRSWFCSPGGFQAYEHRWALHQAFAFHLKIGKKEISQRIQTLNHYCKEQLRSIPKVKLYTPLNPKLSAGMACFEVKNTDPSIVVEALLEKNVISGQTPYWKSLCRFTPGILNTEEEIDHAVKALSEVVDAI